MCHTLRSPIVEFERAQVHEQPPFLQSHSRFLKRLPVRPDPEWNNCHVVATYPTIYISFIVT